MMEMRSSRKVGCLILYLRYRRESATGEDAIVVGVVMEVIEAGKERGGQSKIRGRRVRLVTVQDRARGDEQLHNAEMSSRLCQ